MGVFQSDLSTKKNGFAGTYNKVEEVNVPDDDAANFLE